VPETAPSEPRLAQLSPRYLAALATAALAILVVGFALRPRRAPKEELPPPPSQSEVRRLQRLAQRQALEKMAEHLAAVALEASAKVLRVGAQGSGVAWTADLVVGAGETRPAPESVTLATPSGEALSAIPVVGGPALPIAAFEVTEHLEPVVPRKAPDVPAGEWLLVVWRGPAGHAFAPGHFVETRTARCGELTVWEVVTSVGLEAAMAGGGMFDLDEGLVAVVLPCDGRLAAVSPESVGLALTLGRTAEERVRALYGLRVRQVPPEAAARLRLPEGALVDEVWSGYPGDHAGLRPGDVIVGVGEHQVRSPADLQATLLASGARDEALTLWRGRRRLERRLSSVASPVTATEAGPTLRLDSAPEGYRIAAVAPGSPAAAGGIRPGDRVLRIDFVAPRSAADVSRALARSSGRPLFFEIGNSARRFGLFLP
jgi:hypothetical protein